MKRRNDPGLSRAFDTVRFGERNILNLRESLPSSSDAAQRAEQWIRQKQVEAVGEVLVVTGRGKNSDNGISPVREAVARVIAALRRRNVVERYEEHTPGSFSIQLASIGAMVDAPRRNRDRNRKAPGEPIPTLSKATRKLLRDLAERSLQNLGVKETHAFLEAEMGRQLIAISTAIAPGPGREERIRNALRAALDQTP
jgi:hypothetical protein